MTREEIKELKPGDRVCITMNAEVNGFVDDGETLSVRTSQIDACLFVHCSNVERGGVRRKFKEGDIVRVTDDMPHASFIVREDEGAAIIKMWGEGIGFKCVNADKLTLICAVEDRADRSAAADGSGVTRKGGEA